MVLDSFGREQFHVPNFTIVPRLCTIMLLGPIEDIQSLLQVLHELFLVLEASNYQG